MQTWLFLGRISPRFLLGPAKMVIASSLSQIQTSFIVGHELGHILLGHLRDTGTETDVFHKMEYDADERGVEIVFRSVEDSHHAVFGAPELARQHKPSVISGSTDKTPRTVLGSSTRECSEAREIAEKTFDGFTQMLDANDSHSNNDT